MRDVQSDTPKRAPGHDKNNIHNPVSYIKSLLSTFTIDKAAKSKEITVKMIGNTALPAIVKSPMFACVRKISKNEVTIVAFEDLKAIPTNRAIKLMLTITTDFRISCI